MVNGNILGLLDEYENFYGKQINKTKTSISFSKNVPVSSRNMLKSLWVVEEVAELARYLGLPQLVSQSRCKTFSYLKQKAWRKLQSLKEKLLSQARKEILIKVVALAIPTYSMSYFLLPHKLCDELGKMIAWFWWGQKQEK